MRVKMNKTRAAIFQRIKMNSPNSLKKRSLMVGALSLLLVPSVIYFSWAWRPKLNLINLSTPKEPDILRASLIESNIEQVIIEPDIDYTTRMETTTTTTTTRKPQTSTPPPKTNQVAFLIVEGDVKSAMIFVMSARTNLKGIVDQRARRLGIPYQGQEKIGAGYFDQPKNATFFLFVPNVKDYMQMDREVVFIESFILRGEINPCRYYVDYSPQFGYFDSSQFDYVFSVDPRLRVNEAVSLNQDLLGKRMVVVHPSFHALKNKRLMPYNRHNDSCAYVPYGHEGPLYYAPSFFGGETAEMLNLCLETMACDYQKQPKSKWPKFHQILNKILINNETWPTRILPPSYNHATGVDFMPFDVKLAFDNKDPPISMKLNRVDEDFFADREARTEKLVQSIRENYIKNASHIIHFAEKNPKLQFLSYRCDTGMLCGGFGDRLRGVASLLYLAIATGRIYHIEWLKPVDLAQYFLINDRLYDAPPDIYAYEAKWAADSSDWIWATDAEAAHFLETLLSNDFVKHHKKNALVQVTTNHGFSLIKNVLENEAFRLVLDEIIPDMPDYVANVDYSTLMSASMRLIFGRRTPNLDWLIKETVIDYVGEGDWSKSIKIGVQIRNCRDSWGDSCHRVTTEQWGCFAKKVIDILLKAFTRRQRNKGIVIFVTSDMGKNVTTELGQIFSLQYPAIKVIDTSGLPLNHIDVSRMSTNDSAVQWHQMVRAALDWYVLTQMDWLVISRSSFGETASLYSLKPTFRFKHWIVDRCEFEWYNLDIYTEDTQ